MFYDDYGFMPLPDSEINYGSNMDNNRFFTPEEGLLRGNMFKDEYSPYQNLTYLPIIPKSEKEKLLFKIYEYDFAVNDLSLYLDLHPEDNETFQYFKSNLSELERIKREYESIYGPFELDETKGEQFSWIEEPWPWDSNGGGTYV